MQQKRLEEGLDRNPDERAIRQITEDYARRLRSEHWGERMAAYREQAGLAQEEVAAMLSNVTPTSPMTMSRIENRPDAPKQARTQLMAVLALIAYGVHPSVMGLTLDVIPPSLNLSRILRRGRGGRPVTGSSCSMGSNLPEPVASVA